MNKEKLAKILKDHKLWLQGKGGRWANFRWADFREAGFSGADFSGANLSGADFRGADFGEADFRGADLSGADFGGANLNGADFRWADFRWADFGGANLNGADFRWADFSGADLDFSSGIPFHCGGINAIIDDRIFSQILYHLTRQDNRYLSQKHKDFIESIPEDILNGFCNYRNDLEYIQK